MSVIRHSTVRSFLCSKKRILHDTGWKSGETPPRYTAFAHTRPQQPRWEWRCLNLEDDKGQKYLLLMDVSPALDKWKSVLILKQTGKEPVALMRFEDQPGQHAGGLHVHAHCERAHETEGANSINMPYTLPEHRRRRRRRTCWTKALFCQAAGRFFRTSPITGQEDLPL